MEGYCVSPRTDSNGGREKDADPSRQAIRKVTALLSVEEELADVNAAERTVAIKENERRAITAKLSSEADGTSLLIL
jgi:hypothetical protein